MALFDIPLRENQIYSKNEIKSSQWNLSEAIETRHVCAVSMSSRRVSPENVLCIHHNKDFDNDLMPQHGSLFARLRYKLLQFNDSDGAASEKEARRQRSADQCQSHQRPWSPRRKHKWNVALRNFFLGLEEVAANCFLFFNMNFILFLSMPGELFLQGCRLVNLRWGIVCVWRSFFVFQLQLRLRNWRLTHHLRTDPPLLWSGKILIHTDTPKPVTSILLSSQTRPQRRRGKKSKAYVEACWWCFKYS